MADFRKEFPSFPAADMPAMPEGFADCSWHNDTCPSIKNETLGLLVFIDFVDQDWREMPGAERFSVLKMDGEGLVEEMDNILDTDDWSDVLALIDSKRLAS
jgi:hypothetical protein